MPLNPILMTPYYRHGAETPWGGDSLRTRFGLDIPDDRTGEALVFSALPGRNSCAPDGQPLSALIAAYGERLLGTCVKEPVPLLLKLIDAKQDLSVQVHPDDAYAGRVEGKAGKTEAWIILDAKPGARLVYGIRPGYTLEDLRGLCERGPAVEEALQYLPVQAGDVVYIPSGTVHAIGSGIVLYEIQQSSDVTYRFYDWDRRDAQGRSRELHLEKALAVTRLDVAPATVSPRTAARDDSGEKQQLLDTPFFCVDRYLQCRQMRLAPDPRRFGILTALADGTIGLPDGGEISMRAGSTALLPADGAEIALTGGCFLHAYPQAAESV